MPVRSQECRPQPTVRKRADFRSIRTLPRRHRGALFVGNSLAGIPRWTSQDLRLLQERASPHAPPRHRGLLSGVHSQGRVPRPHARAMSQPRARPMLWTPHSRMGVAEGARGLAATLSTQRVRPEFLLGRSAPQDAGGAFDESVPEAHSCLAARLCMPTELCVGERELPVPPTYNEPRVPAASQLGPHLVSLHFLAPQ